ncbi:hypothetical protein [Paracoccus sp. PAR01]|uniref:hypothetical protein n=1 Tax=Paracoccus sp. PAR01 TaxID=2769282 RepID=UPI00177C21C9|nr:hypothetical protein [Paracoccus sp. PAR01]MBD9527831.1 hypothetical protein [Paracoccus sp. PAR01]
MTQINIPISDRALIGRAVAILRRVPPEPFIRAALQAHYGHPSGALARMARDLTAGKAPTAADLHEHLEDSVAQALEGIIAAMEGHGRIEITEYDLAQVLPILADVRSQLAR